MKKFEEYLIPNTYTPDKLSRQEVSEYFYWFVNQIEDQIGELRKEVKQNPEFSEWEPDLSASSLLDLGRWFSTESTTRDRTPTEKAAFSSILSKFKGKITIPEKDFSPESYRLIISTGIYLGQVIKNRIDVLKWEIVIKPRNDIDINKPVLHMNGKINCNPIHLVYVYAQGLRKKTCSTDRLHELYELWSYLYLEDPK